MQLQFSSQSCDPGALLQNRETGKRRRVLGRVLGKFGVPTGVLARVLRGGGSLERDEEQHPRQHSRQQREFAQRSSQHSPAIFCVSPFLYSAAGRPGRNLRDNECLYSGKTRHTKTLST